MSETRPTKKQRELLSYIDSFITGHGYGPSYREIMRALDYKSVSTVAKHVDGLIAKGHLRKRDNSARSLEVCQPTSVAIAPKTVVTESQEKWLVELISKRFDSFERAPKKGKELDELYVLVGALQALGLAEAAVAAKSRLLSLVKA